MNLQKMLKMQKALDDRIIKEKGLKGQDLLPNTDVALDTELAEFANEGRWFKHWSNNQLPKEPEYNWKPSEDGGALEWKPEYGYKSYSLLEEFVDCIHFFLSIAIKKGWEDAMNIQEEGFEELKKKGFEGGLTGIFLEMKWWLLNSYMSSTKKTSFSVAWSLFLSIGTMGFGFTWDQIEDAYMKKNAINHQRQQEGY